MVGVFLRSDLGLAVNERVLFFLPSGWLCLFSGMDWPVEAAENSGEETTKERADEVGVEVVGEVSAFVFQNLCLEDGQAKRDGWVE